MDFKWMTTTHNERHRIAYFMYIYSHFWSSIFVVKETIIPSNHLICINCVRNHLKETHTRWTGRTPLLVAWILDTSQNEIRSSDGVTKQRQRIHAYQLWRQSLDRVVNALESCVDDSFDGSWFSIFLAIHLIMNILISTVGTKNKNRKIKNKSRIFYRKFNELCKFLQIEFVCFSQSQFLFLALNFHSNISIEPASMLFSVASVWLQISYWTTITTTANEQEKEIKKERRNANK